MSQSISVGDITMKKRDPRKPTPPALDEVALPIDLSRVLGIPTQTIDRWIKAGLLVVIPWHSQRVFMIEEARQLRESPPKRGRPPMKKREDDEAKG